VLYLRPRGPSNAGARAEAEARAGAGAEGAGADVVEVVEVPRLAPRRRAGRERSPPR